MPIEYQTVHVRKMKARFYSESQPVNRNLEKQPKFGRSLEIQYQCSLKTEKTNRENKTNGKLLKWYFGAELWHLKYGEQLKQEHMRMKHFP